MAASSFAQKRFMGLYYAGNALAEIGGTDFKQKLNYDFNIAAAHGKKLRFFAAINGMLAPGSGGMFSIENKNCYVDVTVLDH